MLPADQQAGQVGAMLRVVNPAQRPRPVVDGGRRGLLAGGSGRLEALVSQGETQPLVATQSPERANRRTVTDVAAEIVALTGWCR